jgi:phage tail sheath protein FI
MPGEGTVLWGDKTALKRPSAFDRINVRNLFIVLKKSISQAAKYQLFEINDQITRTIFRNATDRYLESVQGRRGIARYRVVCDETNNTAVVLNANEFVGDIYIDPARSINRIKLNFIAVASGVDFEEVEGA